MVRSLNTWSQINELFGRGSIVAKDAKSNVRQKMIWRVQDGTSFLLKLIRMPNFIDPSGALTNDAITFILQHLNSEPEFGKLFHQLNDVTFKDNFLAYTIVADKENRDKIQFKLLPRKDYPNLPATLKFVSSTNLSQFSETPVQIPTTDDDTEQPVIVDDHGDDAKPPKEEKEPEKVSEDKNNARKFLYLMRTNGIEYLMEFTTDFKKIAAKANKVGGTSGDVSYDQKADSLNWNADEGSAILADPLKSDTVITNGYDKNFLKKMFTDEAFRKGILDEYVAKYGASEVNDTSIKNMLYHRDGNPIFAAPAVTADATSPEGAAPAKVDAAQIQQLTAGIGDIFRSANAAQANSGLPNVELPANDGLQQPNTI